MKEKQRVKKKNNIYTKGRDVKAAAANKNKHNAEVHSFEKFKAKLRLR